MCLDELHDLYRQLAPLLTTIALAQEEIEAAQHDHPRESDRIAGSFVLLRPTFVLMPNAFVYRSHCRELLHRVAAHADTRPGTAAECCIALCETSLQAPLRVSAVGLYMRMWRLAGLPTIDQLDAGEHYEALHGSVIDEHERWLRRRLRQDWRDLAANP